MRRSLLLIYGLDFICGFLWCRCRKTAEFYFFRRFFLQILFKLKIPFYTRTESVNICRLQGSLQTAFHSANMLFLCRVA